MSKPRFQVFEWHAWGPLLVNGRTEMRPCVSLSLPLLGHTTVARFSPPEELIPVSRAAAVRGQVLYSPPPGGNAVLQAGTMPFYMPRQLHREVWLPILSFPPRLLKLDQTHFLLDDSGSRQERGSFWLSSSGNSVWKFPSPSTPHTPHTWNYFLSGFSLQI